MVFDDKSQLTELAFTANRPAPRERVLMVSPEAFRIAYAINPYMKTDSGELQSVELPRAISQWNRLKATYEKLGLNVETLAADAALPDMVFAANQSFSFLDTEGNRCVLLSRMRSEFRRPEISHFRLWYASRGYRIYDVEDPETCFEGNGDALWDPTRGFIWGAFGPRTDRQVYSEISQRFGFPVVRLELAQDEFYHLDTCFSILNEQTVAVYPDALTPASMEMVRELFAEVIEISREECLRFFAGNCHSPNGRDILLHPGASNFVKELTRRGFSPHFVDTSEFIKAGGSVFCLKMMVY